MAFFSPPFDQYLADYWLCMWAECSVNEWTSKLWSVSVNEQWRIEDTDNTDRAPTQRFVCQSVQLWAIVFIKLLVLGLLHEKLRVFDFIYRSQDFLRRTLNMLRHFIHNYLAYHRCYAQRKCQHFRMCFVYRWWIETGLPKICSTSKDQEPDVQTWAQNKAPVSPNPIIKSQCCPNTDLQQGSRGNGSIFVFYNFKQC